MTATTRRRPHARILPYTWMQGDHATPGLAFMHGANPFLHVTVDEARALADKLHDMADKIEAEPTKAPVRAEQPASAPRGPWFAHSSHSAPLTAADGTPEPALPATSAEHE